MSKVKIEGNASGTGTLTISAPNTNTDRTLTLPDTAGEFVTADANGNVGIGTSSPSQMLHLKDHTANDGPIIRLEGDSQDTAGNLLGGIEAYNADPSGDGPNVVSAIKFLTHEDIDHGGQITFSTHDGTEGGEGSSPVERMRIDSSGNVGIGTNNPEAFVHISAGSPRLMLTDTTTGADHRVNADSSVGNLAFDVDFNSNTTSPSAVFNIKGSEKMRISSEGNLLVGKTTPNVTNTVGTEIKPAGIIVVTRDDDVCSVFNRKTSDGDIAVFRKDNSTVGSIGVDADGTNLIVSNGVVGLRFVEGSNQIRPANGDTGGNRDNIIDLGYGASRFDDIYATNGTIQTSDRNEKQQIASLTDAEMNVAKRLSALFKTYKWNASVEENGDNARTHTGIIAQDMQQAFTDEGLDAGNYAMFISSTWWETSTDVPAVEAVAEELDEDGNVVVEAVEAKDAYTRIDTFETQEEAPEGATERTRLGVRYPELFAFINAYNDQRFEALETRIETLENA